MSTNLENQPVPGLFEFLLRRYTEDEIGPAGSVLRPAAVKHITGDVSAEAANYMLAAVNHFAEFCEQFLKDNPPEGIASMSQGFGIRLTGGLEVNLVPTQITDDAMEVSGSIPVTIPRSIRNQQGVVRTPSIDITDGK